MKTFSVILQPDGSVQCLSDCPVDLPGRKVVRRYSEIVPCNPVLLILFRLVRGLFGESGRMSDWTRRWKCQWKMCIIRRSNNRNELLALERRCFREGI